MEDYFKEMRLSREFACQFDKFISDNVDRIELPHDLVKAFNDLKQHYEVEMEKNLS